MGCLRLHLCKWKNAQVGYKKKEINARISNLCPFSQMQEQQALLLLAFKRLGQQQRVWQYFQVHGVKLPIAFEFMGVYTYPPVMKMAMDLGISLRIKRCTVERWDGSYMTRCVQHNGKPTIKRKGDFVEIEFKIQESTWVLNFFPKDKQLGIARVEMSTQDWTTSHEYPLALHPFVNEILEKAIEKFRWQQVTE